MTKSKVKKIKLLLESNEYQRLLKRGEDSITIHSGLVTLNSGESVGKHNTNNCEEIIFVLEGKGELSIEDEIMEMQEGFVFYCPPHTIHDVTNAGDKVLKYIYVTAAII